MRASERADAGEIDAGMLRAVLHFVQHAVLGVDAGRDRMPHGDALDGERSFQASAMARDGASSIADHRRAVRAEIGEDLDLMRA